MPLRPVTCPHCFREVYVNADARCPACQGNVDDKSADHEDLAPAEFVDGEELPPLCVVCAHPAGHYVTVGEKNEVARNDGVNMLSQIVAAIGGLISIKINPPAYVKEYKISVQLPVCEKHRTASVLKPIYVDYRRYRITIPAHPEFIKRWKEPSR